MEEEEAAGAVIPAPSLLVPGPFPVFSFSAPEEEEGDVEDAPEARRSGVASAM